MQFDWEVGHVELASWRGEDQPRSRNCGPIPGRYDLSGGDVENTKAYPLANSAIRPEDGAIPLSVHALLVGTLGKKIIVDSGIGNDKPRHLLTTLGMQPLSTRSFRTWQRLAQVERLLI